MAKIVYIFLLLIFTYSLFRIDRTHEKKDTTGNLMSLVSLLLYACSSVLLVMIGE